MSHSTHVGFNCPPTAVCKSGEPCRVAVSAGLLPLLAVGVRSIFTAVASPSPAFLLMPLRLLFPLTVGVGHISRITAPTTEAMFICDVGSAAFFASFAVGVGHIAAAILKGVPSC